MGIPIIVAVVALLVGGIAGYMFFMHVAKGKYNEIINTAENEAKVLKEKKLLEVKEKFINKKTTRCLSAGTPAPCRVTCRVLP